MNELINYGIKESTIFKIYSTLPFPIIFNIESNIELIIDNIKYLQKIGIECIDEILLYKPYLFYINKEKINKLLSAQNIKIKVNKINNDITNLDFI